MAAARCGLPGCRRQTRGGRCANPVTHSYIKSRHPQHRVWGHESKPEVSNFRLAKVSNFRLGLTVIPELRAKGLAQAHRLSGEDVGVKAALYPREHGRLKVPGERVRMRQDESAPGPAQGLGRGAGDDVGVRQG